MIKHYTFHDNTVTTHKGWISVLREPTGSFFYSRFDVSLDQWGHLTRSKGNAWHSTCKEEMPKEFLVQLLLMGVPT